MDNVEKFVEFVKEYCKQSENTIRKMESDVFEKVGHGLSEGGLYSFLDYAYRQKQLLGYDIPNMLDACLREYRKSDAGSKEALEEKKLAETTCLMTEEARNSGIGFLGLSTRTCNLLLRNGCRTVGDVAELIGNRQLWKIKGLGDKAASDIQDAFFKFVPAMAGNHVA